MQTVDPSRSTTTFAEPFTGAATITASITITTTITATATITTDADSTGHLQLRALYRLASWRSTYCKIPGALADRDGYFVEAHQGTLFLDEIGELPIELQPHLLRALESRRVRRVGGSTERSVDVRIVAATNRLEGLGTESSRLRLNLYHRLATVVLSLPPLRERMSDLPDLVATMLDELAPEHGPKDIADEAWDALLAYSWPGNVRELRYAVARAWRSASHELTTINFFPKRCRRARSRIAKP